MHPAGVLGIGPVRQWVLDHVDDPCVVMVDDDVTHVYSQVGFHKWRIEDADTARAIVERMAILAGGGGNAANRSSERHMREIEYLRRKWGACLSVVQAKGTTRLVVKVKR